MKRTTTILILEDDPVVRVTTAAYLADANYTVIEADCGQQGLDLFSSNDIDIVLLDWLLPDIQGGQILTAITEQAPTIPVIVVSGTSKVKEVADALQRGAWDFLIKPLPNLDTLVTSIERCKGRAELLRKEGLHKEFLEQQVTLRTEELEEANTQLRKQIQERITFEKALADSEERFRQLVENVREVFFVREKATGSFLYVSPAYAEVWGRSCASIYASPRSLLDSIHPNDREHFAEAYYLLKEAGKPLDEEFRIIRPDDEIRWIHAKGFPVENAKGEPYRIVGIAEDITKRRNADDKLRSSLKEKEILLKEVHHRVKNNLQLVSSLLNLQSSFLRSPEDKDLFLDSKNRIQSMTLIHEELYKSDDLGHIDFSEYLPRLTGKLMTALSYNKNITLTTDIAPVSFPVDTAIPCGLIINELFSNALKHAFPNEDDGNVAIQVRQQGKNVQIILSDNGIGFPLDYDPASARSLGMQLVHSLVDQLGAFLDIEVDKGTTFTITFKHPEL